MKSAVNCRKVGLLDLVGNILRRCDLQVRAENDVLICLHPRRASGCWTFGIKYWWVTLAMHNVCPTNVG